MIKRAILPVATLLAIAAGLSNPVLAQTEEVDGSSVEDAPASQSWSLTTSDKNQILDAAAEAAAFEARQEAVERHDAAAIEAAKAEAEAAEDLTTTNNIRFNAAPLAATLGRQFADTPYDYRYGKDCKEVNGMGWHICQRELDIIRRGSPYETNDLFYRKGIPPGSAR